MQQAEHLFANSKISEQAPVKTLEMVITVFANVVVFLALFFFTADRPSLHISSLSSLDGVDHCTIIRIKGRIGCVTLPVAMDAGLCFLLLAASAACCV